MRNEVLGNDNLPTTIFDVFDKSSSRLAETQYENKANVAEPSLQALETREFILDSGASFHFISKKDLSPSEAKTIRVSSTPITLNIANGKVYSDQVVDVCLQSIGCVIQAYILPKVMPLLSMCRITEEHPFRVVMNAQGKYVEHTLENYKVHCRSSMEAPMMAPAIGIPKEDGYVVPSQAEHAGGDSRAIDAGGDTIAILDASIAPLEEDEFEGMPVLCETSAGEQDTEKKQRSELLR